MSKILIIYFLLIVIIIFFNAFGIVLLKLFYSLHNKDNNNIVRNSGNIFFNITNINRIKILYNINYLYYYYYFVKG